MTRIAIEEIEEIDTGLVTTRDYHRSEGNQLTVIDREPKII